MATSKNLKPTNVTISIPAMADTPDMSVVSNCIDEVADAINELNDRNNMPTSSVTNLNDAIPTGGGVRVFNYSNSASNRPSNPGGGGITVSNGTYGIQLAFFNSSSDQSTLYYRIFWSSGSNWGAWRLISNT